MILLVVWHVSFGLYDVFAASRVFSKPGEIPEIAQFFVWLLLVVLAGFMFWQAGYWYKKIKPIRQRIEETA
jgi:hypothetical protein